MPEWRIYKDWSKLVATHGMIGITHQSRPGKTRQDTEDLIAYLRTTSDALKIDKDNMAIWACSANTPTGWGIANDPKNEFIKAVSIYYGFVNPPQQRVNRTDLEILLVRAGLDSHNLSSTMENLMIHALQSDAHVEYINYPEAQHAFDAVDNTPRTREIILQTVDFFKRNLLGDNSEPTSTLISNRQFWNAVITENQTDEAIQKYKEAFEFYNSRPVKYSFWNAIINENNLTGIGYQLLQSNRVEDAIKIFTLGIELFPGSANAYDALSDGYNAQSDQENTLKYAKLALEKLKTDTGISPQFAEAIRASAQGKIDAIENPVVETVPYRRAHHALVYDDAREAVLLTAGCTPLNGGTSFRFFNDIWSYNQDGWSKVGVAGDERSGVALAYDTKRKKVFSFGGFTPDNKPSAQLRVLENDNWKILTDLPEMSVAEPGMVYDEARDRLVVFGGSGGGKESAITWEWDGSSWKRMDLPGPGGRSSFVMAYDSKRKRTIVYGGIGGSQQNRIQYNDTWEYDGKKWTKRTEQGPGARFACGSAFDEKRGVLTLFGGLSPDGVKGDTWTWNGSEWKKVADSGPSPRTMGYMAYDKRRAKIVLFGGRLGWPDDTNDNWEWDGSTWTEVSSVD